MKEKNRSAVMRGLHGVAKELFGLDDPHAVLHQLAMAEFGVESMAHCSVKELGMLADKLKTASVDWKKVENLGVCRIPEMSANQQRLVKSLQKELGWSDQYLIELCIKKYGYLHWKYLAGREAWAYCNFLIERKKHKLLADRRRKVVAA